MAQLRHNTERFISRLLNRMISFSHSQPAIRQFQRNSCTGHDSRRLQQLHWESQHESYSLASGQPALCGNVRSAPYHWISLTPSDGTEWWKGILLHHGTCLWVPVFPDHWLCLQYGYPEHRQFLPQQEKHDRWQQNCSATPA